MGSEPASPPLRCPIISDTSCMHRDGIFLTSTVAFSQEKPRPESALARSLSSGISPRKFIRVAPKPAPLPDICDISSAPPFSLGSGAREQVKKGADIGGSSFYASCGQAAAAGNDLKESDLVDSALQDSQSVRMSELRQNSSTTGHHAEFCAHDTRSRISEGESDSAAHLPCGSAPCLKRTRTIYDRPVHAGLDRSLSSNLSQRKAIQVASIPTPLPATFTLCIRSSEPSDLSEPSKLSEGADKDPADDRIFDPDSKPHLRRTSTHGRKLNAVLARSLSSGISPRKAIKVIMRPAEAILEAVWSPSASSEATRRSSTGEASDRSSTGEASDRSVAGGAWSRLAAAECSPHDGRTQGAHGESQTQGNDAHQSGSNSGVQSCSASDSGVSAECTDPVEDQGQAAAKGCSPSAACLSRPERTGLERSLSGGLSPQKAIKVAARPAPLPEWLPEGSLGASPHPLAVSLSVATDDQEQNLVERQAAESTPREHPARCLMHSLAEDRCPQTPPKAPSAGGDDSSACLAAAGSPGCAVSGGPPGCPATGGSPACLQRITTYDRSVRANLERSLSSGLSPQKAIKLRIHPMPLPEAVSQAELSSWGSGSPTSFARVSYSSGQEGGELGTAADTGSGSVDEGHDLVDPLGGPASHGGITSAVGRSVSSIGFRAGSLVAHEGTGEAAPFWPAPVPGTQADTTPLVPPGHHSLGKMFQRHLSPGLSGGRVSHHGDHLDASCHHLGQVAPVCTRGGDGSGLGGGGVNFGRKGSSLEGPGTLETEPKASSFTGAISKMLFGSPRGSKAVPSGPPSTSSSKGARSPAAASSSVSPEHHPGSQEVWSSVNILDSPSQQESWQQPFPSRSYVPPWATISEDMLIQAPAPARFGSMLCYVVRGKGVKKKEIFSLYTQENALQDRRLLVACFQKRIGRSEYLVARSEAGLISKNVEDGYIGRVRSNVVGTRFQFYDHEVTEDQIWTDRSEPHTQGAVAWSAAANAQSGGWRKMQVAIAHVTDDGKTLVSDTLSRKHEPGEPGPWSPRLWEEMETQHRCHILQSKEPMLKMDANGRQTFHYTFGGRCRLPSAKNFQLVQKNDPETVVLLFGKVDDNTFVMDYSFPLSAFQAFSISLTSMDSKLCFAI